MLVLNIQKLAKGLAYAGMILIFIIFLSLYSQIRYCRMDFFVSLSDRTKSIIGLVALASIIMIIAILVVYFTAAKESSKFKILWFYIDAISLFDHMTESDCYP